MAAMGVVGRLVPKLSVGNQDEKVLTGQSFFRSRVPSWLAVGGTVLLTSGGAGWVSLIYS